MNFKTIALFSGAAATIIAAIVGKSFRDGSAQVSPVSVTTSGSNSPAIVASGNVSVQYGIPPQLLDSWLQAISAGQIKLEGKVPSIETLKSRYLSLRFALQDLSSREPAVAAVLSKVAQGDLDDAAAKASNMLSSNTVKNEQAVRQLREIVTQIQLLAAFSSSPKIPITSLLAVPQANPQRVDATRQIANEPAHQVMILGTVGDPIWQQASADGTIKYVASGLIPTGLSNRSVMFAFYLEPIKARACVKAVYTDDGTAVVDPFVSGSCEEMPVGWVKGTMAGIIRHFPTIGKCQELTWSRTKLAFEDSTVSCEP